MVQFWTVTVIDGIHHRDAENTEKTSIHRVSSVALWMRCPLCPLCLCGSIRDADSHLRGIHHRDAENTEKTLIHRISSVALWMRCPLWSLCLCGSIRDGDSHRRDSPQSRREHREDLNPQNFICGPLDAVSSVVSVSLWFNSGR